MKYKENRPAAFQIFFSQNIMMMPPSSCIFEMHLICERSASLLHHYDGQPNYLEFFPMKASQQREREKEMRRYHMGEPVKMRAFLIDCEAIRREMMHRLNLVV